jgi:hypothetical protein
MSENVIDRIRKLLARSRSDNVHEAALAAGLAHRMMLRHKLSQADVEGEAPTSVGEFEAPGDFSANWRMALLTTIAQTFYARTIRICMWNMDERRGRRGQRREKWIGRVIGRKEDVDIILYLFGYFENAIRDLARKYENDWDDLGESEELGRDRSESEENEDSFFRGAVLALQHRLIDQKRRFDRTSEKALVLARTSDADVKRFIDEKYRDRETETESYTSMNNGSFWKGYTAGSGIKLPRRRGKRLSR